jgi:hypothetical protein
MGNGYARIFVQFRSFDKGFLVAIASLPLSLRPAYPYRRRR